MNDEKGGDHWNGSWPVYRGVCVWVHCLLLGIHEMSGTITVTALSDAEIKRNAGDGGAYRIRCARNNDLRFQYATSDRSRGSWYLRHESKWQKFAEWPQIQTKVALQLLQQARERLAGGCSVVADRFVTVGDLLRWYGERVSKDRSLTAKRKDGVRSIIDVQLLPRIAGMSIDEVSRESIDQSLMWPMQETLSISYVRSVLRVLQMAFAQATRLEIIRANPMVGLKFTDFVQAKIKPKPSQLRMLDLGDLIERLATCFDERIEFGMMALMMLCHGTRFGETRKAQWRHICLNRRVWVIPSENTKTRSEHVLPLTEQACALLIIYRERLKERGRDSDALFTDRMTGKTINESAAFSGFRWMSSGKWSSHDLRKLARTGWVEIGVDYLIGEMLLNHAVGFSAETYINTSADNLKLDALNRWHARLDECGFDKIHSGIESVS